MFRHETLLITCHTEEVYHTLRLRTYVVKFDAAYVSHYREFSVSFVFTHYFSDIIFSTEFPCSILAAWKLVFTADIAYFHIVNPCFYA